MHATIDVPLTVSIDDDKTIPLATLAEFVTVQNIESVLVESIVESLDAVRVEAFCGQKTLTVTVINGSNELVPTPEQPHTRR